MAIYFHHAVRAALAALTCLSWCYAEQVSFHGEPDFDDLAPSFKGNADHNSRRLQDDCVDLEDLFFYDTFIELRTFGSSSHCTEEELAGIGVVLTEAHQSVLEVDPRLEDVVELLVNMCHVPMAEAERKLSFSYSGSGFGFNWSGSGRCRWCPSTNSDADHGRRGLRLPLDSRLLDMPSIQDDEQDHRQLQNAIADILLWDTSNEASPHAIKPLVDGDTFDIQVYGDQFSIEAEVVGDVRQVLFDLDDGAIHAAESQAPYFIGGDGHWVGTSWVRSSYVNTVGLVGHVGTHTVTVTPVAPSGEQLTPISVTYHVVDSSTDAPVPGIDELLWNTEAVEANVEANSQMISSPMTSPTRVPTNSPTTSPTRAPTNSPTTSPTRLPTDSPTTAPTRVPTDSPVSSVDVVSDGITGLILWDTSNEASPRAIQPIIDGDTVDVQVYGDRMSIEAEVVGDVDQVMFDFDNGIQAVERNAPYFIGGDHYLRQNLVYTLEPVGYIGTHTVMATAIAPSGAPLTPVSVTYHVVDSSTDPSVAVVDSDTSTDPPIAVIDSSTDPPVAVFDSSTDPPVAVVDSSTDPPAAVVDSSSDPSVAFVDDSESLITGFKLWNTEVERNPQAIKILKENDEIDIYVYGDKFSIEAIVWGDEVDSVQFEFDDIWLIPIEKPPYFLFGYKIGDYDRVLTYLAAGRTGRHTVKATPSTKDGVQMTPLSITFRVVDSTPKAGDTGHGGTHGPGEVIGFKLWDTSDESLPQFLKSLEEGDVIDLDLYGGQLTIEAEVSGDVERVDFGFDDKHNYHQKYSTPFTLAGNSGYSLFVTCWPLATVGEHIVTAMPLSSSGEILTPKTITFTTIGETTEAEEQEEHVQAGVTGFLLWDTSDEFNPKYLRTIKNLDVIDINYYGTRLTIEAEYVGKLSKVVFGLDDEDEIWTEEWIPYILSGNRGYKYCTTSSLSDIGTHTVTAKPYALDGNELPSVSYSFLIVDGSTNAADMAPPESREQLINLLEDDLSFYLSGIINHKYFYQSGHCLQWNLAYVKVELTEVEQQDAMCDTRRQLPELDHNDWESDSTTTTARLRRSNSD